LNFDFFSSTSLKTAGRTDCTQVNENSVYGINEGRISKLMLKQNGEIVYNYDRGIDIPPQTIEAEKALAILLKEY